MGHMSEVTRAPLNLVELVLVWELFESGEVYFSDGLKEDSVGCFPFLVHISMG